jgi:hypothetical protein
VPFLGIGVAKFCQHGFAAIAHCIHCQLLGIVITLGAPHQPFVLERRQVVIHLPANLVVCTGAVDVDLTNCGQSLTKIGENWIQHRAHEARDSLTILQS